MLVTFHYRMFYLPLCYKKNLDKNIQNCMSVALYGCETRTLSQWWKIIDLVWEQCAEEDIWTCQGRKYWETGDNYILRSFMIYTVTNNYYDQITEYGMCQACSIHGRNKKFSRSFGQKSWKAKTSWKPSAQVEGNVAVDLQEAGLEGGNLTHLAQGTIQYQDHTNLWLP